MISEIIVAQKCWKAEKFGNSSVCVLATGVGSYVRCFTLEYSYHDVKLWIFTEGSEKFIGLEKNNNVSFSVFVKNHSSGKLKSVQVIGKVAIVERMSAEYVAHVEYKNAPVATLQRLTNLSYASPLCSHTHRTMKSYSNWDQYRLGGGPSTSFTFPEQYRTHRTSSSPDTPLYTMKDMSLFYSEILSQA